MRATETGKVPTARIAVLQAATAAGFVLLAGAFWFFQVIQHEQFREMAENNHQRELALRAPRGVLFDRHGRVLVENRHSYSVSIVRLHTTDLDRTIRKLAAVAGLEEQRVREVVDRARHLPSYRPIVVLQDATLAQVAAIMARRLDFELPDVVVERVPTRRYPTDALGAHLLGYVGEASDAQLTADGLRPGAIVGQAGVERTHNRELMGRDGARTVVVNSMGREIRTLDEVEPTEGRRLMLTIDYDVQKAAEDGFKALGYWGAAAAIDPRSGEVLALVSLPSYDPNSFATGIDRATWSALNTDRLRPLQNRVMQGRYSPGSTFKIVVATAALEEDLVTPDFKVSCSGGGTFHGRYFRCHKKDGHGVVDMRHAIEKSCNVYFYTLGNMLGVDRIHKWSTRLGLGVKSEIDLPNEAEGLVPSTEWKRRRHNERWYAGETISVAIGQGQVSVTPISMAVMMATVANGGTRFAPRLVKAYDDGAGWKPLDPPPVLETLRFKPSTHSAVRDGLWMAVNAAGTAGRARIPGLDVSGKTGTAQVISLPGRQAARGSERDLRDHGWFVFFAPRDNPEIAGVIFGEHSEHGYSVAPIARHMIATYFARKRGEPLPAFTAPGLPPPTPPEEEVPVEIDEGTVPETLPVAGGGR